MIFTESKRLRLRKARIEDVEPLVVSWGHPEMTRWTEAREDTRGFLTEMVADMQVKKPGDGDPGGPWYQFILERKEDGALIGDLGAGFGVPGPHQIELGYRILPRYHRQGYAREAVSALIDWLIAEHRVHRFVGLAAAGNTPSTSLLRSLGFRREGLFRESFLCRGEWIDDEYWALLAREWRAR